MADIVERLHEALKHIRVETGDGLKRWRLQNRMTQKRAAEWYGVSERSWRRYERGEVHIPRPLLIRVEERKIQREKKT